MVSWVPEVLLPCLLALAFLRELPRKWVLAMAPTTYLADLDYLLPESWAQSLGMPHMHRVAFHTLVLRALILGALWVAWWRLHGRRRTGTGFWRYAITPGWPLAALLLCYYLTAHALMDVFTGGVVLLWPLSNLNFYVDVHITCDLQARSCDPPAVDPYVEPGPYQLDTAFQWLTNEHAAMLALVAAVLLGLAGAWLWRTRKAARRGGEAHQSLSPSTKGK